jgi:uncharacterized delta-60 repeat protein
MLLPPLSRALRRSFVFLPALVCAVVSPMLKAQSATDGFNPSVTGSVNAILIQPDGKIILGGIFSALKPNGSGTSVGASGLVRLNVDGTVDPTFAIPALTASTGGNTAIGAQVNVLALQSDGKILVGGNFGASNGGDYLVRLNANGSIDGAFAPKLTGNVNGAVTAIYVVPDTAASAAGSILIGGNFTAIQSGGAAITRNHVARLNRADGSVDTTWNPNASAQVDCFAVQADGKTVIGGAFTTVNPASLSAAPVRNHIARLNLDGSLDTSYDPNANNQVASMALQPDGKLLIAGSFTTLTPLQPGGAAISSAATVGFIGRLNTDGTVDSSFTAQASANISTVVLTASGKIVIGGNIGAIVSSGTTTTSVSNVAQLNYNGTYDTTFSPAVNSAVNAVAVQSDGKIIIGGTFTQITSAHANNGTPRLAVARLDANGILDADFSPSTFGGIGVIVVQPDGKYLVSGSFSSIGGVTVRNLARLLPNGTLDATFFNPNPDFPVNAIALQSDGKILIGGAFGHLTANAAAGDRSVYYLARLNADGTQDTSYNPYPSGPVYAIVLQPDGKALVGGNFVQFSPNNTATSTTALNLARLNTDGTVDTTFLPNPGSTVHGLVIDSSKNYVIAVGDFTSLTPTADEITTSAAFIARITLKDGRIDTTFAPQPSSSVLSVALQADGKIVFGGVFNNLTPIQTPFDPTTHTQLSTVRRGVARVNADGSIDASFDPEPDGSVTSVAVNPGNQQVYIGGLFKNVGNVNQPFLARLSASGAVDTSFSSRVNGIVNAITPLANNQFIAGGAFTTTTAAGAPVPAQTNHLARFNADGSLDTSLNLTATLGGSINALALEPSGQLLVGGSYSNIGGVFAANIARFYPDGTFDNVFGPNPNGPVNSMVVESNGSSIYVGGSFTSISGSVAGNLARINADASFDSGFNAQPNGAVFAIAPQSDGKLVVGGTFTAISSTNTAGTVTVGNLARVAGSNGAIDTAFNPKFNGPVRSVVVLPQPGGQILVGGTFTALTGGLRTNLARLNSDGSLDPAFNPNIVGGSVNAIAVQPNGQIVLGGSFTQVGGVARANFARLNADGSLDAAMTIAVDGPVNAVVLENGGSAGESIVLGGAFATVGGVARNRAARLIPSGAGVIVDPSYNPNADGPVNTIAFGFDGKSYLGGSFSNVSGLQRLGIARVAATGKSSAQITVNSQLNTFTWTLTGEVPEINSVIFEISPDGTNYIPIGAGVRNGTTNSWTLPATTQVPSGDIFVLALADAETTQYGSQSEFSTLQHFYGTPITALQSSATATGLSGSPFYYEIGATNSPTSITAAGLPAGLTINPALGIISGTPTVTGTFPVTLTITNVGGTITQTISLTIGAASSAPAAVAPLSRMLNLSSSATVSVAQSLVGGFYIAGSGPKTVLIRAIGPALSAFKVAAPLAQPHLTVYNGLGQSIITAQGWDGSQAIRNISARVGAFPLTAGTTDTALVTVLAPGRYTYAVSTGDATSGTALAEVYDADLNVYSVTSYLSNISSQGLVDAHDVLIGGFALGTASGAPSKKVLIRGIGPALGNFGVAAPLPDPMLNVYNFNGILIASNQQFETQATTNGSYPAATAAQVIAAAGATGAFALTSGSADTSALITFAPGVYTAQVTTAGGNSGVGQIELYDDGSP